VAFEKEKKKTIEANSNFKIRAKIVSFVNLTEYVKVKKYF